MPKVKEYSAMTKDKLMLYTFIALLVLVGVSYFSWGITPLILSAIAVLVAVGIDFLIAKVAVDSEVNTMSAAVFGLIVALSYSLGLPSMYSEEVSALMAPDAYFWVVPITVIGMGLFKKVLSRKYVNPAAAAKLLVFLPLMNTLLLAKDHLSTGMLGMPSLAGPIGYAVYGDNGLSSFAGYILTSFANPAVDTPMVTDINVYNVMILEKFHGWIGGASSIAVIIVGIALFVICRRYIKWRITVAYLGIVTLLAFALAFMYGDPDPFLRPVFHLFIGSSIFLAFFMATDPASTPLTHQGQLIFGVGLGALTLLIQTYTGFFGGSILALVLMNLTSPYLDKIGKMSPTAEKTEPKLPKAKQFEKVKVTQCIRCGACMRVCCHKLSPILIKEAFDKTDIETLSKLQADLCDGCGHCNFVCPARIDIRGSVLRGKALLRQE
jgi:electron transport complex protein RnfD